MIDAEEFEKNKRAGFKALQSLNKGALDSKAVEAILLAAEKAIDAVVEKHPRRGDSWEEAFSTSTCFNLAGAKIKRIELLLEMLSQSKITPDDVTDSGVIIEEVIEEAGDAIAYIAFGMWQIGKI